MSLQSAAELMVLLLYSKGKTGQVNEEIKGITRMEKLMYLLLKEGGFEKLLSQEMNFKPYDFGPYSVEIYSQLESLKTMEIIKIREEPVTNFKEIIDIYYAEANSQIEEITGKIMEIYSLTQDRGFKIATKLISERATTKELECINDIKIKYNQMVLEDLLRYVYSTYPDSAKKSKIIEKIFGFGRRPELKPFKREGDN